MTGNGTGWPRRPKIRVPVESSTASGRRRSDKQQAVSRGVHRLSCAAVVLAQRSNCGEGRRSLPRQQLPLPAFLWLQTP
ncbi:unnamed protein product [Sphagnum jensenii]